VILALEWYNLLLKGAFRLRRERTASGETSRVCWRLVKRRHINIHGDREMALAA